jgi:glycogen synthase
MKDKPKPRRVLMTADTIGGVWTYAIELTRALEKFNIEVVMATMGSPLNDRQKDDVRATSNLTVYESSYKLEWMQDPWEDVRCAGEWLLQLEQDVNPDVVHLNNYAHAHLPWRSPKLVVGHSCVMSWWCAVRGDDPPECWDRYRTEISHGLGAADLVVAPSRAMLLSLIWHYGSIRASRVILNGRDASLFRSAQKEPFVLTAGRLWDNAKNIAALEEIAANLPWPVYVAGENRHPEGGAARCEGLCGLGLLSPEDLSQWYARASIYVLPARYEPFGLTALEAALSGCALVLGDIPSLREIWGNAALFVPPHDSKALEKAILELISDDARRLELSSLARARGIELTPHSMASGYLDAYGELLEYKTDP